MSLDGSKRIKVKWLVNGDVNERYYYMPFDPKIGDNGELSWLVAYSDQDGWDNMVLAPGVWLGWETDR